MSFVKSSDRQKESTMYGNPAYSYDWSIDPILKGNIVFCAARVARGVREDWSEALRSLGSKLVILEPSTFNFDPLQKQQSILLDAVDPHCRCAAMNIVEATRVVVIPEVILLPDYGVYVPSNTGGHLWRHYHAQDMLKFFCYLAFGTREIEQRLYY